MENSEGLESLVLDMQNLDFDTNKPFPTPPTMDPDTPTTAVNDDSLERNSMQTKAKQDAQAIYQGNFEGLGWETTSTLSSNQIAAWMAQGTPYHSMVLQAYLALLKPSIEALPVELAFRVLCSQLLLRGETQQINRVLTCFASTYLEARQNTPPCPNQPDHLLLSGLEPLEIVITSMVMLNTILHNPTARDALNANGAGWKKQWTKSTAEALGGREWEIYLEELYNSIELHPIRLPDTVEKEPPKPLQRMDSSRSSIHTTSSFKSNVMNQAKKFTKTLLGNTSRTQLTSTPSFVNPTNPTQVIMSGILIKKNYTAADGSKAKNRNWIKYWCNVWLEQGQGTLTNPGRLELHMHKIVEGKPDKDMDKLMSLTDVVQEDWSPDSDVVEVQSSGLKRSTSMESTMSIKPKFKSLGNRSLSTPNNGKWIYKQPEVLPLLHSLSTPLPGTGYSPSRPYVFSLLLFDGSTILFQTSSSNMVREWCSTLNRNVALKSKRVLRGGISNVEYGWSNLLPKDNGSWDPSQVKLVHKDIVSRWRIGVWQPPDLAHVVGTQTIQEQIQDMKSQIEAVEKELSTHTPLRVHLERQFQGLSNQSMVLQNWTKKNQSLALEYRKYGAYLDMLQQTCKV